MANGYEGQYSHAQTFAILSVFVLVHHYECSGFKSMGYTSKLAMHRKSGTIGKVVLGRWYLSWFGDSFGTFPTKAALKYLAGRKKRDGYEKRELSHYKPGEFTKKQREKTAKGKDPQTEFDF